jgi:hypothetical protein
MYPTTIAGLVLIVTALRYAMAPDAARALVIRRLSILTLITGCLGTVVGVMKTFLHATDLPASDLGGVIITGIGESLHNLALSLCMLAVGAIGASIGAARRTAKDGDELIAP